MAALPITHGGPGPVRGKHYFFVCVNSVSQAKAHKVFDDFAAISYRAQIVAGKNFIFKILVGGENYIHAKVFWALPCYGGGVVLVDVQENKTKTDSIEPF
uniref:Cystatin domain-containing protein n=1 Tax=Sphaeramia orbicularis TaxID=375764 RepID=A0A672ZGC0_9TELE